MAQQKQNQDFAALAATGLPIRFACGQHGDGRIYLGVGKVYQGFWNNKRSTDYHIAQAPTTRENTSRGRAFKWSTALIAQAREQHAAAIAKTFEQLGQPAEVAQKLTAQHSERIDALLREWSQSTCNGSDLRRVLSPILPDLFRLYEARELAAAAAAPASQSSRASRL